MKKNNKTRAIVHFSVSLLLGASSLLVGHQNASAAQPLPVPPLMITEVVPDSSNALTSEGKSVDGYEYFEIYNNSSMAVPLNNYKLKYVNGSTVDIWAWNESGLVVEPRSSIVIWVRSPGLNVTLEQFNANYSSNLTAKQFGSVSGQGLANTGARTLTLSTADGLPIASASFNGTNGDVAANLSIVYQYPADGTTSMRKNAVKQQATPGQIVEGQAPESFAPAAPTGLTAAAGDREVRLTWVPGIESDVTQYRVVMNGNYTDYVTEDNALKVSGLTNFTNYTFSVVAINDTNNMSVPSNSVTIQPKPDVIDHIAPAQPQGLTAAAGVAEVQLAWAPNQEPDVASYRIYRDRTTAPVASVTSSTYSAKIGPLTGNISYQFQVTAVDSSGNESVKSAPVTAMPTHQPITQEDTGIQHNGNFPQYAEFFDVSEQGAIVPGLKQGLVPQGMHYIKDKNWIVTSSYRDDKRASVLTIIDAQTGGLVKTIHLMTQDNVPYTGHAGGVAVSEKYVWIANNSYMYQLSLDAVIQAADNSNLAFIGKFKTNTRASFGSYSDGVLWVGEYYSTSPGYDTDATHKMTGRDQKKYNAWIAGYKLDPSTDMVPGGKVVSPDTAVVPDYILSVTDRVQGVTVLGDQVLLSQTNGASYSSLIKYRFSVQDAPHTTVPIGGASVPVWFMDDVSLADSLYMPSSAEGNFVKQGKAYILYESGALKYQSTVAYPLDRLQIVDLDAWAKYNTIGIQGLMPTMKRQEEQSAKAVLFQGERGTVDVTANTIWTSSDPNVAAISSGGTVTAVNPGEAVIQAKNGSQTASFRLQVLAGDNAALSGIQLNGGLLAGFDSSVTGYTVNVPNSTNSVSFSAQPMDSRASVQMNGTALGSGDTIQVPLTEGANVIRFVVTAENGNTTATYTVTVNRSAIPKIPANVKVRTDHSQATVSWTANTDQDLSGYNVYVDGNKVNDAPVQDTSYVVKDLHNGKYYDFIVTAVNRFQEESEGTTVNAHIKPTNDKTE
ncbi:fibronectin type III domain-containing protein [Paenibacillus allorhizosphaerae]|uniref:Fibronectin type III domain-containing protein n=1 Tax=Paenibacillus allorhizosphaerae TaxID=2849866 RepID=A0ABM8VEA9_9BACL|nr:cadherin-like beta sandwich domain-containing protein [Paenibacillus allorhizosphaerae]CAG7630715.1 hypothetical protein PAECIP111802_01667 [Paenibacillus allorhizosphaerae]